MRVFIAGATGAVGRLLVPLLVQAGHEAFAAARSANGVQQLRAQGANALQVDVHERTAERSLA